MSLTAPFETAHPRPAMKILTRGILLVVFALALFAPALRSKGDSRLCRRRLLGELRAVWIRERIQHPGRSYCQGAQRMRPQRCAEPVVPGRLDRARAFE